MKRRIYRCSKHGTQIRLLLIASICRPLFASPPPATTYAGIDLYTLSITYGFSSFDVLGSSSSAVAGNVVGNGEVGDG